VVVKNGTRDELGQPVLLANNREPHRHVASNNMSRNGIGQRLLPGKREQAPRLLQTMSSETVPIACGLEKAPRVQKTNQRPTNETREKALKSHSARTI